jgi:hypothetical protein
MANLRSGGYQVPMLSMMENGGGTFSRAVQYPWLSLRRQVERLNLPVFVNRLSKRFRSYQPSTTVISQVLRAV